MIRIAAALALCVGAAAIIYAISERAGADRPVFRLPVDCDMGIRCYIQSHVDRDPGPGFTDFSCGSLSYDGHKGVDFRVATFAEMAKGVGIIAVAPGAVRAIRDGVEDLGASDFPEGQDCGNAVVLIHDDGWETQYCHLAKGSVVVREGDHVKAGDRLGAMGYTGRTEFPHLHLSVRKDGDPIDPFGAQKMAEGCDQPETDSLWSPDAQTHLTYQPGGIVDIGITDAPPDLARIRQGDQPILEDASATTLIVWGRFFGVQKGDVVTVRLIGPAGEVIRNDTTLPRNRAEEMRFAGKRSASGWPKGAYTAIALITRGEEIYKRREQKFELN